jgi:hypothetical protein
MSASRITVTSVEALRFNEPFGHGPERHDGVRAASSISPFAGGFLIAQDDSNFAALVSGGRVEPLRLFPRGSSDTYSSAQGNKQLKPDLESSVRVELGGVASVVLLGSGSLPARMRAVIVSEATRAVRLVDLTPMYELIRERLCIPADALNLEGACRNADGVHLFQRGNAGPDGVNARVRLSTAAFVSALEGLTIGASELQVERHALGQIAGAPLGFSGADGLPGGSMLFSAAAEASPNTYDDGPCAGSALGVITSGGALAWIAEVPRIDGIAVKIEGVAVERVEPGVIEAVAVTDADDPGAASLLMRLRVAT